jgi:protein O-GlcNAc transferase
MTNQQHRTQMSEQMLGTLKQAAMLRQAGDLKEARRLLKMVLRKKPDQFDALHLMGLIEAQRGNPEKSEKFLADTIRVNPSSAEAHANLGNVQRELGKLDPALASFDRALQIRPNYANALSGRGTVLAALRRHDEAVASYAQALAIDPRFVGALQNRAVALREIGRLDEALADCDRVLSIDPKFATAQAERGRLLIEMGRNEEALEAYDRALALNPRSAEGHYDRGLALLALERLDEALASFENALAIAPDFVAALSNRGNVLLQLRRAEEALSAMERALALAPDSVPVLNSYGNVLLEFGRIEDAIACFDKAFETDPGFEPALMNRGGAAIKARRFDVAAECFQRLIDMRSTLPYLAGSLMNARLHCCDWRSFDALRSQIHSDLAAEQRVVAPFHLLPISDSAEVELRAARIFVQDRFADVGGRKQQSPSQHARIRVAYVSTDFRAHAVAHLIAELIERHDRSRFEIVGLSIGTNDSSTMRERLARAFDKFVDVSDRSDQEVADLIRNMEIDIAVDLNGFTDGAKTGVFALRPAGIQVNYLGYPGTMGAPFIDYIIADPWVIPRDQEGAYSERIVRVPDSYQANDSTKRIADATPSRSDAGLPETGFVFCSFNNSFKLTPTVFDVWMRLLRTVEGSVLWLLEGSDAVPRNLHQEAQNRGIDPGRLVFAPRRKLEDHLARHRLADLFLDTLPYNAHTTASDALWAGLPVVTCLGSTFAGRVAASLLNAVGLPELITHSLADYEALALDLARHSDRLASIKSKLIRNRASAPLFDTSRYARHIESAYVTMWERHQRGEPPVSFSVESMA